MQEQDTQSIQEQPGYQPPETVRPPLELTPQDFLSHSQNPRKILPQMNAYIKQLKRETGADNRTLLRCTLFLLESIANTMPWDPVDGLDAKRHDPVQNIVIPSYRSCIGALLGLTYTPKEEAPSDDEPEQPLHQQGTDDGTGD